MADVPAELTTLLSSPLFESITLIDADHLSDDERATVLEWWLRAIASTPGDAVQQALAVWQTALPDALPAFTAFIQQHGIGIFLGRSASEAKPLLVYAVAPPASDLVCWCGYPPTPDLHHPAFDLDGLPARTRRLYTELHDGFKLAYMFHNGFVCSAEWFAVGEDVDAESAEIVGGGAAPDLDTMIRLLFDFGASSVCVELGGDVDSNAGWVISDSQLRPVDDIWVATDKWLLSLIVV